MQSPFHWLTNRPPRTAETRAQSRSTLAGDATSGKPRVALLVSSTSRNSGYRSAADFLLLQGRLQSFLEHASGQAKVCLLLAYDQGDEWFESHHEEVERLCRRVLAQFPSSSDSPLLEVHRVANPATSNPVFAWNFLFERAATLGIDYCLQLGDDILCQTPDWDAVLIAALRRSGNWGVAGGWSGNDDIITQAFVHTASHRRLFRTLYPPALKNWGSDTWIDHTYRSVPGLRHWLPDDVVLVNSVVAHARDVAAVRYAIADDWRPTLRQELVQSRERLARHFEESCATPVHSVCTTATRRDIPALHRLLYSLRLFEPTLPVVVAAPERDVRQLDTWRLGTGDVALCVVPSDACDRRFESPTVPACLRPTTPSLVAALRRHTNTLHLPPQAVVTAKLGSMPRWGTLGLLPRFLKSKHQQGQRYDGQHAYAARSADHSPQDGENVFDLTEGYGVSDERLRKGRLGVDALQHGEPLEFNGVTVRTISTPRTTLLNWNIRRRTGPCWRHLWDCRDENLRRLARARHAHELRRPLAPAA